MKKIVGLIVNPVAGMGGSVGLKGTDGGMYERALELGAAPVTPEKAHQLLAHISRWDEIQLLVAPGNMGADYTAALHIPFTVVDEIGETTTASDTKGP